MTIIWATILVGGVGLLIGLLLGLAGVKFKVEVDEKEEAVAGLLPGNNCGGCGYAGCSALAKAIAQGQAPANGCPVGGDPVAQKIAAVMGVEVSTVKQVAFVTCGGDCKSAGRRASYTGNISCKEVAFLPGGGDKNCTYGCLGYGSCVAVCDFGALSIVDGVALVDRNQCVACGKCVKECPKGLIELVPFTSQYHVACSSREKGKEVMAVCGKGCIGCKMCEKVCPQEAITVTDNLAHIDYEKCTSCGACAAKCPKKIILFAGQEESQVQEAEA